MKILIDARLYGLEHAGLGRYTMNLVNELANLDRDNNYQVLLRKRYFNTLDLPKNWEKVLADIQHYSFSEQFRLPLIIKDYQPDFVHFTHFNAPIVLPVPFIVTIHDMLMHQFKGKEATTLPWYKYNLKRVFYRLVFSHAIKASAQIIVPTATIKKALIDYFNIDKSKISVINEGYDKNIYSPITKTTVMSKYDLQSDYFIYVGNAYPHKNLETAIKALLHFNKVNKKEVIFAIGTARGVFFKRLKQRIEELKANQYVKLLGFVPDSDLGVLLKNSLGFLYPSLSEGFGLQGLEATAAGTLILASDIAVFKEIYEDHALYFKPKSHKSIAKAMKKVVKMKKKERLKRIRSAQQFIRKYSWSKMAKETLEVYRKVRV